MTTCSMCYPRNREPCRCGTNEGERRKDNAIGLLALHREFWIRKIQRDFLQVLLYTGEATADDVSNNTPPAIRRNTLGAAVNHLARARLITPVGFAVSTRPERHACPTRVWRITDRDKAIRWLAVHPELPDPTDDDQGRPPVQTKLF